MLARSLLSGHCSSAAHRTSPATDRVVRRRQGAAAASSGLRPVTRQIEPSFTPLASPETAQAAYTRATAERVPSLAVAAAPPLTAAEHLAAGSLHPVQYPKPVPKNP
jgi:hypothetical protein